MVESTQKKEALFFYSSLVSSHRKAMQKAKRTLLKNTHVTHVVERDVQYCVSPRQSFWWRMTHRLSHGLGGWRYCLHYLLCDRRFGKNILKLMDGLAVVCLLDRAILRTVRSINPDRIVCMSWLTLRVLSRLKEKGLVTCPVYAYVIDYTAEQMWVVPHVDVYWVPFVHFKKKLVALAVPESKIEWMGIMDERVRDTDAKFRCMCVGSDPLSFLNIKDIDLLTYAARSRQIKTIDWDKELETLDLVMWSTSKRIPLDVLLSQTPVFLVGPFMRYQQLFLEEWIKMGRIERLLDWNESQMRVENMLRMGPAMWDSFVESQDGQYASS